MSNYWCIKCSCGEQAGEINHGGEELGRVLAAVPEILALHAKLDDPDGVSIPCRYRENVFNSRWFVKHSGSGHVLHVEDEYGAVLGDPKAGG